MINEEAGCASQLGSVRQRWLIALLVALAFVLAQLPDIATYPTVGADEALLNDPGWQLVQGHGFRSDVLRANPGFATVYAWQPPGLALSAAASYATFGFGIWQTRLPGILYGGAAVALAYLLVCWASGSRRAALLSAALLSLWPPFVVTAKSARMDTAAIAALLAATLVLFITLSRDRQSLRGFLGAGLLCGVAGLFHPIAINWSACLALLAAIHARPRVRALAVFALSAALPVLLWMVVVLQHPGSFEQQFLVQLTGRVSHEPLWQRVRGEISCYLGEWARVPLFPATAALVVAAWFTLRPADLGPRLRLLVTLAAALAVLHAFTAGKVSGFYSTYPTVLFLLILAIGLDVVWSAMGAAPRRVPIWLVPAVIFALLGNLAVVACGPRVAALMWQRSERKYGQVFGAVSARLHAGDRVWGSAVAWYAVARAGATLDSQTESVPIRWHTAPDPRIHRFVIVDARTAAGSLPGFVLVDSIRPAHHTVLGRHLTPAPYRFDIYESSLSATALPTAQSVELSATRVAGSGATVPPSPSGTCRARTPSDRR